MAKRKKDTDLNITAFQIMEAATGQPRKPAKPHKKNPAAVALGRLGGIKGGKARAERLTSQERTAIAKKAARARWSTKPPSK